MNEEQLRAWLDSMPPDEREQMLEALYASYVERGEQLDVEQQRADELRGTRAPRMRDAGRFTVAANPLEFAGALAQRGVGEHQARGIAGRREEMASQKERALQALVAEMLRGGRGASAPAPAPAAPGTALGRVVPPGAGTMAALSRGLRGGM